MKRKIIPLGLLFAVTLNIVKADHGMPPMVTNVNYQQRTEPDDPNGGYRLTKFVDITYNLEGNRSCFVEFFFSYDGGITFPILCTSMTGAQGPGIDPGYGLTATWDAGTDWNQQYTERARIRIKATYGDSPTGNPFLPDLNATYPGMPDSNATDPSAYPGPPYAASDLTVVVPAPQSNGPTWGPSWAMIEGPYAFSQAITMYADKFEVTYGLWEKVRQWGRDNGYADLVTFDQYFHYDQPYEAVDLNDITSILNINMPADPTGMTNSSESDRLVIMEQVMKWMNARSEMEGFEPAYYVDGEEPVFDDNGDGVITQGGTDSWYPDSFDYEDPNFEDPYANPDNFGADPFDPNGNYRWDPGETFIDRNGNGIFEPMEFMDVNGNRIRETGHTVIYRVGSINWDANGDGMPDPFHGMSLNYRKASNGYALPDYEMLYLTFGGRLENSMIQTDPTFGSMTVWQPEWPWGGIMEVDPSTDPSMGYDPVMGYDPSMDSSGSDYLMPPESVDYISNLGDNPMGVVGTKMPNGYGMYDTLGNYEELQNYLFAWNIFVYGQGAYGIPFNQDGSLVPLGFRGIRVDYATD